MSVAPAAVRAVIAAGATDIGENYVQEGAAKRADVGDGACWHFIGRLQRNKAGRAVAAFDYIHTVDSAALGAALARQGAARGRVVRVLVEVRLGGEASKAVDDQVRVAQGGEQVGQRRPARPAPGRRRPDDRADAGSTGGDAGVLPPAARLARRGRVARAIDGHER